MSPVHTVSGRFGVGDGAEQRVPVGEDDVGGDGAQVLEEAVSRAAGGHGGAPRQDAQVGCGVEGECQKIEGRQEIGQGGFAMAEVEPPRVCRRPNSLSQAAIGRSSISA